MTVARSIPEKALPYTAVPFKLFIPKQLDMEPALRLWQHLRSNQSLVLADPFAAEGVSTVFPGAIYTTAITVDQVVNHVNELIQKDEDMAEELAGSWVEMWVPDALEDEAEALDVTDLTQP